MDTGAASGVPGNAPGSTEMLATSSVELGEILTSNGCSSSSEVSNVVIQSVTDAMAALHSFGVIYLRSMEVAKHLAR